MTGTGALPIIGIVDDDIRLRDSLTELFAAEGLAVAGYASARDLLDGGGLAAIDCLVTDVSMPGIDGFELRRRVGRLRPELTVILMSGRHELIEAHLEAGGTADRIFRKPFSGSAMLAAIREALARRHSDAPPDDKEV